MRLSDAIGGLAVGGVIVLIALSLADSNDPAELDAAASPNTLVAATTLPGNAGTGVLDETGVTTTSEPAATTEAPTSTAPPTSASIATTTSTTELVQPNFRPFIQVQVLNAGARAGQAGAASDQLVAQGFAPRPPRDTSVPIDATTIQYAPGREVEAATVNQVFGLDPDRVIEAPPDDPNWLQFGTDLHVLVILGPQT